MLLEEIKMPQKLKVDGPATPDELRAARVWQTDRHDQERLIAMQMAQEGRFRISDIAAALGRSTATIVRWLRQFREGGILTLLKRGHGGRKAKLKPEDIYALEQGLREGKWKSAKEIHKWLTQERQIPITFWGVH
jgi:transposase